MKSLREIENAIAELPPEAQAQLVRDMPTLCPSAFPADGWDAILADPQPRPALSSLLDRLETDYAAAPEKFAGVNEETLCEPPKR
jgi:hypothetical protein